jgi:predicted nucleic acid-binding protein
MIRVVLDTNVVVFALLKPSGAEALVLLLAVEGTLQLCASEAVLAEYHQQLGAIQFGFQ